MLELMIVTAIIGIMAAVALPNMMSYVARSRQTECKSSLGALRAVLESHFADHGVFTDNLANLGFQPSGSPLYLVGFTTDALPSPSGVNDTAELHAVRPGYEIRKMRDSLDLPLTEADLPPAPITATSFKIGAVGNIDVDDGLDRWTYDRTLGLVQVDDDTTME